MRWTKVTRGQRCLFLMMGQLNPRLYELAMHKLCTGEFSVRNAGINEDNYKHIQAHFGWPSVDRPFLEPAAINAERSGGVVWQRTDGGMVRDGGGVAQLANSELGTI